MCDQLCVPWNLSSKLLTVLTVTVNKSVRAIYVGWEDVGLGVVRFKAVE